MAQRDEHTPYVVAVITPQVAADLDKVCTANGNQHISCETCGYLWGNDLYFYPPSEVRDWFTKGILSRTDRTSKHLVGKA